MSRNGCTTVNLLQRIRLGNQASGITLGLRQLFVLDGKGTGQSVNVDWGDGAIEQGVVPVPGCRHSQLVLALALFHTGPLVLSSRKSKA